MLKISLQLVLGVTILFAAAELGWRLLIPELDSERTSNEFVSNSLYHLRPCARVESRDGVETLIGMRPEYPGGGFVLPLDKPAGHTRIAVVGESSGAMMGAAIQRLLTEPQPNPNVELLNCASAGSALEHMERQAREALEYHPDVLIVLFGHNLMMRYPTTEWLLRLQALLRRSRLMSGLAERTQFWSAPPLQKEERLKTLEQALRTTIGRAQDHDVRVVLNTMVSNLWYPPAVMPEVLNDQRFLAAQLADARGDHDAAIKQLTELIEQQSEAYWDFVLGTWLARSGRSEAAARRLRAAIEEPQLDPDRCSEKTNELIRRIAKQTGATLNDTERKMRAVARDGLPGWDILWDHCHLLPQQFAREAAELLRSNVPGIEVPPQGELAGVHIPEGADVPQDDPTFLILTPLQGLASVMRDKAESRAYRDIAALSFLTEFRARTAAEATERAMGIFLSGAPLADLTPQRRGAVLASIARGYWWAGRRSEALAMNERARREGAPQAWIELALFRISENDLVGAREALTHASSEAPDSKAAAYYLGALP